MLVLPINLTLPLFSVARRPRLAPHVKPTMSKPVAPKCVRRSAKGEKAPPFQSAHCKSAGFIVAAQGALSRQRRWLFMHCYEKFPSAFSSKFDTRVVKITAFVVSVVSRVQLIKNDHGDRGAVPAAANASPINNSISQRLFVARARPGPSGADTHFCSSWTREAGENPEHASSEAFGFGGCVAVIMECILGAAWQGGFRESGSLNPQGFEKARHARWRENALRHVVRRPTKTDGGRACVFARSSSVLARGATAPLRLGFHKKTAMRFAFAVFCFFAAENLSRNGEEK